jgi:hypothetical protein
MAELITGDTTKGIKSIGELALRISKFDGYRLFTLYENVRERKVMDVSGNHKYYLVFKSPKKEIRIPEYEPNGFFEVDKVNGCILFKITKKNAEDILSLKTGGQRIFHIVRVFEERDSFGKVLSVTDEVEVYNGKWGDDAAFAAFTTENKIDLLSKALAAQVDKNATQLNDYKDLLEKYNAEVQKTSDLEKEMEALRAERDSLQTELNEYKGDTHEGTLLSTDTKYIAFENTLDNISFTEEQYKTAMDELLTKGEVNLTGVNNGEDGDSADVDGNSGGEVVSKIKIQLRALRRGSTINVYKNLGVNPIFSVENDKDGTTSDKPIEKSVEVSHGDVLKFIGINPDGTTIGHIEGDKIYLKKEGDTGNYIEVINNGMNGIVFDEDEVILSAKIDFYNENLNKLDEPEGNIGTLKCYINWGGGII